MQRAVLRNVSVLKRKKITPLMTRLEMRVDRAAQTR